MRRAQPEHALQVRINRLVREHVAQPHLFLSVDAAKRSHDLARVREKARGVVAGTPDTLLICPGLPLIAIELKAPGNRPTERQEAVGAQIRAAGHRWGWCDSAEGYFALLHGLGVPLIGAWQIAAQHADAILAGAAIRTEEKRTRKPSGKRFAAKPSRAALAAAARGNDLWGRTP